MTNQELNRLISDIYEKKKISTEQLKTLLREIGRLKGSAGAYSSKYAELRRYLDDRNLNNDVTKWRKEKK